MTRLPRVPSEVVYDLRDLYGLSVPRINARLRGMVEREVVPRRFKPRFPLEVR